MLTSEVTLAQLSNATSLGTGGEDSEHCSIIAHWRVEDTFCSISSRSPVDTISVDCPLS